MVFQQCKVKEFFFVEVVVSSSLTSSLLFSRSGPYCLRLFRWVCIGLFRSTLSFPVPSLIWNVPSPSGSDNGYNRNTFHDSLNAVLFQKFIEILFFGVFLDLQDDISSHAVFPACSMVYPSTPLEIQHRRRPSRSAADHLYFELFYMKAA